MTPRRRRRSDSARSIRPGPVKEHPGMLRAVGRAGTAALPQPVPIWTSSRYRVRGSLRNPQIEAYRVQGFVHALHARTAERLRDGYLECLLGVAGPTARVLATPRS